jgi:hypothetical protein
VRREIRGGVVDIMQCSCLSPSVGKIGICRSRLSLQTEPQRGQVGSHELIQIKSRGELSLLVGAAEGQSCACFMITSHKELTCCPPFRRPKVSGGSVFAEGELKEEE